MAEGLDRPGGFFEGPLAQGMGADDPVAGVRLDRPPARIEPFHESGDRGGAEIRHEAQGALPRRLEAVEGVPERERLLALDDHQIRPADLALEPVDLPADRIGIILEADGQRRVFAGEPERLADGAGGRGIEQVQGHGPGRRTY